MHALCSGSTIDGRMISAKQWMSGLRVTYTPNGIWDSLKQDVARGPWHSSEVRDPERFIPFVTLSHGFDNEEQGTKFIAQKLDEGKFVIVYPYEYPEKNELFWPRKEGRVLLRCRFFEKKFGD